MSDARVSEIPQALRALLHRPEFKTKARRMGKIIRVTNKEINYYTFEQRKVKTIALEDE
jgi:hypothetical protein